MSRALSTPQGGSRPTAPPFGPENPFFPWGRMSLGVYHLALMIAFDYNSQKPWGEVSLAAMRKIEAMLLPSPKSAQAKKRRGNQLETSPLYSNIFVTGRHWAHYQKRNRNTKPITNPLSTMVYYQ